MRVNELRAAPAKRPWGKGRLSWPGLDLIGRDGMVDEAGNTGERDVKLARRKRFARRLQLWGVVSCLTRLKDAARG